jgi:hypothetical protein
MIERSEITSRLRAAYARAMRARRLPHGSDERSEELA